MNQEIGIIDRGVGGFGLFKKLREQSDRPITFFSDNGSIAYGLIEKTELKARLDKIIRVLNKRAVQKIILACNSASVVYPDNDDIQGIIKFGVSSLIKANANQPALIATTGTVNSGAYKALFDQNGMTVTEQIAQPLAAHVERGNISGKELEEDVKKILLPIASCDAILMACTHFPALKPILQQYAQANCKLIDPVDEMSLWIKDYWPYSVSIKSETERTKFLITGSAEEFIKTAQITFGVKIDSSQIEIIELY